MVSNVELILRATLGEQVEPFPPASRVEYYLNQLKSLIEAMTGGLKPIGETTTALTDGATTNPIKIDGEDYTAQDNDIVFYGNKEFLFINSTWREIGDLTNLLASMVLLGAWTAGTATSHSTPLTTDTVLEALQKIDNNQRLDESNITSIHQTIGNINTVLEGVL
jgi:hypothetical protein